MKLAMPTEEELRMVYQRDLEEAFPPEELKPLSHIVDMRRKGRYRPLCLYDSGEIIGECFLWDGNPGWTLLDYLCVTKARRNGGLGSRIIRELRTLETETVILGESENPAYAPDPALARRRLGFYERSGTRLAGYDTELFGVRYHTLYWADSALEDAALLRAHQEIYQLSFLPEKYARHIRIPYSFSEEASV